MDQEKIELLNKDHQPMTPEEELDIILKMREDMKEINNQ